MRRRAALKALGAGAAAAAGLQFPFVRTARAQDRYAKYRGSTIVVQYRRIRTTTSSSRRSRSSPG